MLDSDDAEIVRPHELNEEGCHILTSNLLLDILRRDTRVIRGFKHAFAIAYCMLIPDEVVYISIQVSTTKLGRKISFAFL